MLPVKSILTGLFLLVLLTVALLSAGEACHVFYNWSSTGWPTSGKCSVWTGCTDSDAEGNCQGVIRIEIDDLTLVYTVFSCNSAQKGVYKYCTTHPEAKCVKNGSLTCLTFKAWSESGCHGECAVKYVSSTNCTTQF